MARVFAFAVVICDYLNFGLPNARKVSRDAKEDKLKVSKELGEVDEARANNKARHILTSRPSKTVDYRGNQHGSRPGPHERRGDRSDGIRQMFPGEWLATIIIYVSSSNIFKT